jgi:hypothetical protein
MNFTRRLSTVALPCGLTLGTGIGVPDLVYR